MKRKTCVFRGWVKLQASSQGKSPNTLQKKFENFFLSVLCDWKFYLQKSRKVNYENLWVPSRLEPPPANKSPDWAVRNNKNSNFEKYSKYFSWLGHWPASELQKISLWAHNWDMRLDQLATESLEQGKNIFLKFFTFLQKQKTFQKQLKHSKIFLCLINKDWACENTFNKVQSYKWIWHSLNIDLCEVCGYQKWDSP